MRTRKNKILAIDDKQDNLLIIKALMKNAFPEMVILTAASGVEGLACAAAEDPDVVLLDIIMPEMDGYEVCRRLKSDKLLADIPVVFLTVLKDEKDTRIRALEAGGEGFISKPFDECEFIAQIKAMVKIRSINTTRRTEEQRLTDLVEEQTSALRETQQATLKLLDDLRAENDARKKSEEILRDSEARYRLLFNTSMDAILVTSPMGEIFSANPAACLIFGQTEKEICAGGRKNIVDVSDPRVGAAIDERSRTGKFKGELTLLRGDGGSFPAEIASSIYQDKDGDVFSSMIIRDITDRKRIEDRMRTISRAVEQSPASVVITNTRGEIEYVNPKFTALTGYALDDVQGKNPRVLKSGDTTREEYARLWKLISSGREWHGEFHNKKKDGALYWESASVSPIVDEQGVITHYLAVKEDITERKRTEEALRESEERYRMLIRNQGEGISLCDIHDQFMFANPAAEELFQVPPGTLRGRNWRDFILPEYLPAFHRNSENQILGERSTYEIDVMTMKGERRSLLITAIKQSDKKGMYTGTFTVFRDITERKKVEEQLRVSEEYDRTLVETTPDAIAIIDARGRISFASVKVYSLLAVPQGIDVLGRYFLDWVHPNEHMKILHRIHELYSEARGPEVLVYSLVRSDATIFWGEVSTSAILNAKGAIAGILILCRDVTEKIKFQQELVQSQKLQSIGRLAGGIAHDFNNILGIILAYTSMLEKTSAEPQHVENLNGIDSAVKRGAALVKQILTFARKTDTLFEPMNIVDLLHELSSMLKQTFPKTIEFTEHINDDIPLILTDRTQMHQALLNLCVNARDAMPRGGSLTMSVEKIPGGTMRERFPDADKEWYVSIAVADTGEGMTEDIRVKIFDPFFTTKAEGKGTGLGLSVVFGVVQSHHGYIDVTSAVGHGSTFNLYLPVSEQEQTAVVIHEHGTAGAPRGTETILVVEDEDFLLEMAVVTLESHGYRVYAAQDGIAAVEMYKNHRDEIALVFSDMGLPGMTGQDVFLKLKEIDPEVKLLFASGYIVPEVRSDMLRAGARGFIQKPYAPKDVLLQLRAVLDGR